MSDQPQLLRSSKKSLKKRELEEASIFMEDSKRVKQTPITFDIVASNSNGEKRVVKSFPIAKLEKKLVASFKRGVNPKGQLLKLELKASAPLKSSVLPKVQPSSLEDYDRMITVLLEKTTKLGMIADAGSIIKNMDKQQIDELRYSLCGEMLIVLDETKNWCAKRRGLLEASITNFSDWTNEELQKECFERLSVCFESDEYFKEVCKSTKQVLDSFQEERYKGFIEGLSEFTDNVNNVYKNLQDIKKNMANNTKRIKELFGNFKGAN